MPTSETNRKSGLDEETIARVVDSALVESLGVFFPPDIAEVASNELECAPAQTNGSTTPPTHSELPSLGKSE